ncbi:MAG: hypothetical protein LBR80_17070 [Deltaproteobacteria bacterium]|jgi:hypothetical protein|nr:hypothetical protein [Deltaproteobacteria bacterium]
MNLTFGIEELTSRGIPHPKSDAVRSNGSTAPSLAVISEEFQPLFSMQFPCIFAFSLG